MLTLSAIVNNYLHKHCFISYTTKNKTKYKSYRYINILIYTHIQTTRNTFIIIVLNSKRINTHTDIHRHKLRSTSL